MPRKKKTSSETPKTTDVPESITTNPTPETPVISKKSDKQVSGTEKLTPPAGKPVSGTFFAYGRRKTATARVRLHPTNQEVIINGQKLEKGDIYVNNLPIDKYFPTPFAKAQYNEIYRTTNTSNRFITTVLVEGSGKSGQLGAVTLAIARALCQVDPKFKTILRKKGFMTRDPRAKERKKPGLMGARKQKSSPKR